MKQRACAVAVKQMPERLSGIGARHFFKELDRDMTDGRASIVLDCSQVCQVDRGAIYLLLCCLEEAIKRDGDVKLAGVSSNAGEVLKITGVDRLFERFETNEDAINSFRRASVYPATRVELPGGAGRVSEMAE